MEALDALLNRVSVPRLTDPAPNAAQREGLFQAALRAPDHGQLRPWRFLTIEGAAREALGELFAEAIQAQGDASQAALDKARAMPLRAPLLVVVIARLQAHPKVPAYMAFDSHVHKGLGLADNEELIGYLYLGTPTSEPRTPPVLDTADFVTAWGE